MLEPICTVLNRFFYPNHPAADLFSVQEEIAREILRDPPDIAFFSKQSAAFRTEMRTTLDGRQYREYPVPRQVI
jgi:hypothetical protein